MIRRAEEKDLGRIAEILVFNNRLNFFPIFRDEEYSFGEMTVEKQKCALREGLDGTYVYEDGILRGFIRVSGTEIVRLYVEPALQGKGVGAALLEFAAENCGADHLWALEKNTGALRFYARHGFVPSGERQHEEDTAEWLILLKK